jgi:hypothetical protein
MSTQDQREQLLRKLREHTIYERTLLQVRELLHLDLDELALRAALSAALAVGFPTYRSDEPAAASAAPAAPERYCEVCGAVLDNLWGEYLVTQPELLQARSICFSCLPAQVAAGWTVVAQARVVSE